MRVKALILFTLSFVLLGCNVIPDPIYEPAKLESLKERKVKLQTYWLDSSGIGDMWRGYELKPVISDNQLFTTDVDGWIRCLDLTSKSELWTYQAPSGVSAPLIADAKRLYLATQNGDLIAVDRKSGLEVWTLDLKSEAVAISQVNTSNNLLALSTSDSKIIAVEAPTGVKKWQFSNQMTDLTLGGAGAPLVTDMLVYAPLANGKLAGLDTETGEVKFLTPISVATGTTPVENLIDLDTSPQLLSGLIFVAGFNGKMAGVEAFSGKKVWDKDYSTYRDPLIENNTIYLVNDKSEIEALDFRSGSRIWTQKQLYGRDVTAPVFLGKNLVVADAFGYLHILDKTNGEIIGRLWFDAQGVITPLVSDGTHLVAQGRRGKLGIFKIYNYAW